MRQCEDVGADGVSQDLQTAVALLHRHVGHDDVEAGGAEGLGRFRRTARGAHVISFTLHPSLEREAHQILSNLDHVSAALTERWLQQALPGRRVIIEELLAQDDLVAVRLTVDGKHQAFCFTRIEGGKIVETWHNFDQLRR